MPTRPKEPEVPPASSKNIVGTSELTPIIIEFVMSFINTDCEAILPARASLPKDDLFGTKHDQFATDLLPLSFSVNQFYSK